MSEANKLLSRTPDALFHYLRSVRRRAQSWQDRLFLRDEGLLTAGIERLVETVAIEVEVFSQHEKVGTKFAERPYYPEGHPRAMPFHDGATPKGPKEGRFVDRTEGFHLRDDLEVKECDDCGGRGQFPCTACDRQGTYECTKCGGTGFGSEVPCGTCRGTGIATCQVCNGSGTAICSRCDGTGQVGTWTLAIHWWNVEQRSHLEMPVGSDKQLREASRGWTMSELERVSDLEPDTVARHLGYETPESREVVLRAIEKARQLEAAAHQSYGKCLFTRTYFYLVPIAQTVLRKGTKAHVLWLVGHGANLREIKPRARLDPWKCLGWLGLGVLGWLGLGSLGVVPLPAALAAGGDLGAAMAVSGTMIAGGLRQIFHRALPMPVVAVLSTEPTPWLTCLAFVGSFTGRLKVLDRNYEQQLLRLLREPAARRRALNLSLVLDGVRRVRMVEVATFDRLPKDRLELMLGTVDALLLLQSDDRPEKDLLAPLQVLGDACPPFTTVPVDGKPKKLSGDDGSSDDASSAGISVEALHRAYVEDMHSDVDWEAAFEQLWKPVEDLLGRVRGGHGTV